MSDPKYVYFVRHGQTEWNAERRMQGQWNSNLNPLGRKQAAVNAALLEGLAIDALFVSPLDRTRQTAEIINAKLDLPMQFDDRIKEWDCGDWSGNLYADIEQRWPEEWQAWRAEPFHYRGPNCENYPDMMARAQPFLDELRAHPARSIAVVSHGMIGRIMVSMLLGHNEQQMLSYHQKNDVVFRVSLEDGGGASVDHYSAGEGPFPGLPEDEPTNRV